MIRTRTVTVVPPADEPLTLAEAKSDLRVVDDVEDATIADKIRDARSYIEETTGLRLLAQTIEVTMDLFPTEIVIPWMPVTSVESVTYVDADGIPQVLSSDAYQVSLVSGYFARIRPAYGTVWPAVRAQMDAVSVRCIAGYATRDDLAAARPMARRAIRLLVGHWYENREAVSGRGLTEVPLGVQRIIDLLRPMVIV